MSTTNEQVVAELAKLSDELASLSSKMSEGFLRINTRIRALHTVIDQDRNLGQVERAELLSSVTRLEEQVQRIEEQGQRVEKISPHGLATRVPLAKLEEARRIVREAEAKGQPIGPTFDKDEDISGVWMVATNKLKWKIPNRLIRSVLLLIAGAVLSYFGLTIHDAAHTPSGVQVQQTPAAGVDMAAAREP